MWVQRLIIMPICKPKNYSNIDFWKTRFLSYQTPITKSYKILQNPKHLLLKIIIIDKTYSKNSKNTPLFHDSLNEFIYTCLSSYMWTQTPHVNQTSIFNKVTKNNFQVIFYATKQTPLFQSLNKSHLTHSKRKWKWPFHSHDR